MVQNGKRLAGLVLAVAITAGALAGCSTNKTPDSSAQPSETESLQTSSAAAGTEDFDFSAGLTEDGYFENVNALQYVTLPDYRNMEIPEDVSTISDEKLESELESRLSAYATSESVTDRAVEDGDTVNIDYVGTVDGVEFQGGNTKGRGTSVTIGVTRYIDDFLEQLIGHMPGETFDVNVTFPEDYGEESLNGKDAVFSTTINYISEETIPELTNDFVFNNWSQTEGWANVAEAKEGVREELRQAAVSDYLWDQIQSAAKVSEVPASVLAYHTNNIKNSYSIMASQSNMEINDFLSQYAGVEDMDELVEKSKSQLEESAKTSLILQALAEEMDVRPTDDDVMEYVRANANVEDTSSLEAVYGRAYLCWLTRENLVLEKLGEKK